MIARPTLLLLLVTLVLSRPAQGVDLSLFEAPLSGGTIHCDGARRGSAVMVKGPVGTELVTGVFVVSAAHVFYDLRSGRRYDSCHFDYRGLEHLPGHRAGLVPKMLRLGEFDPREDPSLAENGHGDWAVAYLSEPPEAAKRHRLMGLARPAEWPDARTPGFYLLAWDPEVQRVAMTGPCEGLPSTPADIGGGVWPGQWLDDCGDGPPGSSGGGLLWLDRGKLSLLAIRTGAHWRLAPPRSTEEERAPWDPAWSANTSRGIDSDVLGAMRELAARATR